VAASRAGRRGAKRGWGAAGRPWRVFQANRRKRKVFFFEKKNQKTLSRAAGSHFKKETVCQTHIGKVFWFFFSKKNTSLF
jgi:hypothetical protein